MKSGIRGILKIITLDYQLKTNTKVDAFTLTEILVVIVISTIVVGLALSVLNIVQQNFYNIRENYQTSTEIQKLKQQLAVDFNRFNKVVLNEDLHGIQFKNPLDSLTYTFSGDLLLRKKDTIPLQFDNLNFYFKGEEVKNGKIDAVKLYIKGQEGTNVFVEKINDARTYVDNYGN